MVRAVESMEQTTTVVTITIKRAVTSIVRKETIWDGQHRLTILQSGQAMASSMNHHRIRSFSVMLFTRQRLSVRSMETIILSIHRKTAMNFAMQQARTTNAVWNFGILP